MTTFNASFLKNPALVQVMTMLNNSGYRALIVGGAVRNSVIGQPVEDIDISTDAHPEQVINLAKAAGLKPIPTGITHGTITVVAAGTPFEITTFRRDVETDGRNATVVFSDCIEDDAARRDFTMNALYMTITGQIIDTVNGLDDLNKRILCFVGDPVVRIREDYLRILRFFRFFAWYAHSTAGNAINAIKTERTGLSRVSAERVGKEIRKLLNAPDPSAALMLMAETGVLEQILPGSDISVIPALITTERKQRAAPDWRRRLYALGAEDVKDRLRLSRAEAGYLAALKTAAELPLIEAAYHLGHNPARDIALIAIAGNNPPATNWAENISKAAKATLPITGAHLIPNLSGKCIGDGLKAAEHLWIKSNFTASRNALICAARQAGIKDT